MLAHSLSPRPTSFSHSSLLSPPSTHIHRSLAPPPTTTTSGGRESLSFSVPSPHHGDAWRRDSPSTPWGMSLSAPSPPQPTRAFPRPPSPPPRVIRARQASAGLSRMLTHLRPTSALALARPARDAHSPPPQERNPCVTTYGPGPAGPTPALLYPRDYTVGQEPPPGPSSGTGQPPTASSLVPLGTAHARLPPLPHSRMSAPVGLARALALAHPTFPRTSAQPARPSACSRTWARLL